MDEVVHYESKNDRQCEEISKKMLKCYYVTIDSSIGYVVLSGNIQVDKHEITLTTPFS